MLQYSVCIPRARRVGVPPLVLVCVCVHTVFHGGTARCHMSCRAAAITPHSSQPLPRYPLTTTITACPTPPTHQSTYSYLCEVATATRTGGHRGVVAVETTLPPAARPPPNRRHSPTAAAPRGCTRSVTATLPSTPLADCRSCCCRYHALQLVCYYRVAATTSTGLPPAVG